MEDIIRRKLKEIEDKENVKIIAAVESGSRAWGFASPDSDYDVRFIYVRRLSDYLSLGKMRDVIEWELNDELDINGWDITKALRLMHESNPTIFEWCASPIVYKDSEEFNRLKGIRSSYFSKKKSLFHYMSMARHNYDTYITGDQVKLKKYFYVIRPLLAALWIIDNESQPPMLFSVLVDAKLPGYLKPVIDELVRKKGEAFESELSPRIMDLDLFIEDKLSYIQEEAENTKQFETTWDLLNDFYYKLVVEE